MASPIWEDEESAAALSKAGIDGGEVLAAVCAAFAGKRPSTLLELDSVAHVLGHEYGVELEPSVRVLALDDEVYRTAYQLSVRGGGHLTLVRLRLPPRKRIVLAYLSEKPDRQATPDHDRVGAALTFVDFSYLFHARSVRPPTPEEGVAAPRKRGH
jgi:hypothetical protein